MTLSVSRLKQNPVLDTVERIQSTLRLSKDSLLSAFELTHREYQFLFDANISPNEHSIARLADQLELDPLAILNGNIDFGALFAHFHGSPTTLPEKYSFATFSKRRTSIHLLNSVEQDYGWRIREKLLRQLQVNESIFMSPDKEINIQFVIDLCKAIQQLDPRDNVLFFMGQRSVNTNYLSPLGEIYRGLKGSKEIYEMTFQKIASSYYDKNTDYQLLNVSNTSCKIKVTPNLKTVDALGSKVIGSIGTCEQKRGTFSSLPLYKGFPPASTCETRCIHRGDPYCLFDIDFSASTR